MRLLNGFNTPYVYIFLLVYTHNLILSCRISGMMTARYLIHLREWEHKHNLLYTTYDRQMVSSIKFLQPTKVSTGRWTDEFMNDPLFDSGSPDEFMTTTSHLDVEQ